MCDRLPPARVAERLPDAVEAVFGPIENVARDDNRRHWRLRSDALRRLVSVSAEELAQIASAAAALERAGFGAHAKGLLDLATKLRATLRTESLARLESDLETLVLAEGLAMRPGPRSHIDPDLLALLREATLTCRMVEFRYFAQSTARRSRQRVRPHGLLYGNRMFLVAMTDWSDEPRLWRLANVSERCLADETFDRDPTFDLQRYARRSFGTFQEESVEVALRFGAAAARDASAFLFHPDQSVEENGDGSVTVRFTAGGIDEMCWHLFTWGEKRHRREARPPSPTTGRDVRVARGASSRSEVTESGQRIDVLPRGRSVPDNDTAGGRRMTPMYVHGSRWKRSSI